jgi:hypothetical protein
MSTKKGACVIFLGALPQRRRRTSAPPHLRTPFSASLAPFALSPGDCVISVCPPVSAALVAAGVPHRDSRHYVADANWRDIHARVATQLQRMRARATPPLETWLDDWSHLLGGELREACYWTDVAAAVLRREQPEHVYVQRLARTHPAGAALRVLRDACAHLGRPSRPWPAAR